MSNSTSHYDLSLERFLVCFYWVIGSRRLLPPPILERELASFWSEQFADDVSRFSNQQRFLGCVNFLNRHMADFVVEHWIHHEGDGIYISPHLQVALYSLFWSATLEQIANGLPLKNALDSAAEQQRLNSANDED